MSKADKRRRRAQRRAEGRKLKKAATPPARRPQKAHSGPPAAAARPTAERAAKTRWSTPDEKTSALTDLLPDVVAALHIAGQITDAQEMAARAYQQARADYLAEFPELDGFSSCLNFSVPGFDDGDGNPAILLRFRRMEKLAGPQGQAALFWTCAENREPNNLVALKAALTAIDGA